MSLVGEILDFLAPRHCVVCGNRLSVTEEHVCTTCLWHLPRTNYHLDPYHNEMAKLFWGRIPIEKAASWFLYNGHSDPTRMILELKYHNNKEIGEWMGRVYANEIKDGKVGEEGLFSGIDYIVPVPITCWRKLRRGYNQSVQISKGISEATGIPVLADIIGRRNFRKSQTKLSHLERIENIRNVFYLTLSEKKRHLLEGKHILLVDDVVTTGSTVAACAEQIAQIPEIKISILSLGRTKL